MFSQGLISSFKYARPVQLEFLAGTFLFSGSDILTCGENG